MTRAPRIVLLSLCLPLGCAAADWVEVSTPDANRHFYDHGKLLVDGDAITYWRSVQFRSPQPTKAGPAASAMYRERIDCRLHTHRTLGYLLYAKNGAVIENVSTSDAQPEPIIPETLGDHYEKLMCALAPEVAAASKAVSPAAASAARTPEEVRQEIEWLEARLRILREQLEMKAATEAAPPAQAPPAAEIR
jgi:hypothetical protein